MAFEYCGLYWHSDIHENKPPEYHATKYKRCLEHGIQLFTIFEDEWLLRKDQVKQFLKARLGVFENRVYARNCEVRLIPKETVFKFCNSYHIQGRPSTSISAYGLFYKEELLGVVSYGKHHRNSKDVVLNRLCFKDGWQIVGGASKLIKTSIKNFESVTTWSDNRWSTGNLYLNCGFDFAGDLAPDYSYTKNNQQARIPKQKMKKSNIGCPKNITEKDFCRELGFYRIYDCGKKKFIYKGNS